MFTILLQKLCVNFDDQFMLHDLDWIVDQSDHWVVTGPNGSGKSALMAALTGSGDIESGMISGLPESIAVVSFEAQAALIEAERRKDDADILDVITEGTPVREVLNEVCVNEELQASLIDAFDFGHLLDRSFRKLSTGETRKVMLIRALTSNAELLLLDEPFEGLDQQSDELLHTMLKSISQHTPTIMVLNRFDEIPEFSTHIAYMDDGRLAYKVDRKNKDAVQELEQLLHLSNTSLTIPAPDNKTTNGTNTISAPLVTLNNGRIAYGDTIIFENLDWCVEAGQHWQVSGPNGSGKTCLLNLITGDHPQCYVNDIQVFGMQRGNGESIWDIKKHIGYVSSALQWEYKVSVSVRNAIISGFYDSIGIYQQYSDNEKRIANEWLELLGMSDKADRPFNQLSFGDQRMVLIARAMVKHPPLLILDEPCLGLDDLNRNLVLTLIEKICNDSNTTVLYVNHRLQDSIPGINNHLALGQQAATVERQ